MAKKLETLDKRLSTLYEDKAVFECKCRYKKENLKFDRFELCL